MKKFNIIAYRLKQNTKPCDVLETFEALFKKFAFFTECFFRANVKICEYKSDGKFHSNRNRNAVNTLLKRYPELKDCYRYIQREKDSRKSQKTRRCPNEHRLALLYAIRDKIKIKKQIRTTRCARSCSDSGMYGNLLFVGRHDK